MIPGRYVRLAQGQFVCNRRDVMGVVSHLHDLARHLEGLMPDENDMIDTLTRSRDFAGGFATRAAHEQALQREVLEALSTRAERHGYEPLRIEGYAVEAIESAVYRLWREGLVDAHSLTPKQVTPSTLTTKGFRRLKTLAATQAVTR